MVKYKIKRKIRETFKKGNSKNENISIKDNTFEIKIKSSLYDIKQSEIEKIYSIISAFRALELRNNELDEAWIQTKVEGQWSSKEFINIFNLVRKGILLIDWYIYFENFEHRFSSQSTETKFQIDDYMLCYSETEQKIVIKTYANIWSNTLEILKKADEIHENLNRKK